MCCSVSTVHCPLCTVYVQCALGSMHSEVCSFHWQIGPEHCTLKAALSSVHCTQSRDAIESIFWINAFVFLEVLLRKEDIIYFSQTNIQNLWKIVLVEPWKHGFVKTGNGLKKIMFFMSVDSSWNSTHAQIRHSRRHIQVAKLGI